MEEGTTMKSVFWYQEALVKAGGAGSRGGHVIGHTKTNKPIYSHAHAAYGSMNSTAHEKQRLVVSKMRQRFPHFSGEDHKEAAVAHQNHAVSLQKKGDLAGAEKASNARQAHAIAWHGTK